MSGVTHPKSRKSTLTDRKDAAPTDGEDFSLREDEMESNDGTRDSTRRHRRTLQQFSSPSPNLWSSKQVLTLAFVFIVPLAFYLREKLDEHKIESERMKKSLDAAQKENGELQENETQCRLDSREQIVQLKHLKEKVDVLNNELKQMMKSLSDTQKEKEELGKNETQCRLDMKDVEKRCAEEKYQDKEEYRSDAEQSRRAEREKLEYEIRLWREEIEWLIECMERQNTDQDGFILTRAFNAIVRAIKSGFGRNSDEENCLKMFGSRFQRRISD